MPRTKLGSGFAAAASRLIDATITWDTVGWIRSETKLPVVVKGVIAAADAHLAVEAGVSAIVVSNHGGRQLDGCEPTLRALPNVVEAVAGRVEVLIGRRRAPGHGRAEGARSGRAGRARGAPRALGTRGRRRGRRSIRARDAALGAGHGDGTGRLPRPWTRSARS